MKKLDINIVLVRLNKIEEYLSRLEKYQNLTTARIHVFQSMETSTLR